MGAEEQLAIRALREGLGYAIQIIESYQHDIARRNDLMDQNFCQGTIYREAVPDILRAVALADRALGLTDNPS